MLPFPWKTTTKPSYWKPTCLAALFLSTIFYRLKLADAATSVPWEVYCQHWITSMIMTSALTLKPIFTTRERKSRGKVVRCKCCTTISCCTCRAKGRLLHTTQRSFCSLHYVQGLSFQRKCRRDLTLATATSARWCPPCLPLVLHVGAAEADGVAVAVILSSRKKKKRIRTSRTNAYSSSPGERERKGDPPQELGKCFKTSIIPTAPEEKSGDHQRPED